ncbi:MAG: hemolysin family protein [Leptolyngbyaceae cyanobacterium]
MRAANLFDLSVSDMFLGQAPTHFTPSQAAVRLLSVFLLIAINAFFVTAEFSIVSVRRSRINQLVDAGDIQARTVQDLQQSIDRLLSTTQIGITLSSLALGWIGENAMASLVSEWMLQLPIQEGYRQAIAHSFALPVTFFLLAYLQIVLGELCPKSMALLYSEQLARFLGAPSVAIARIFHPFVWIVNQSTRLLLRLLGIQYTNQGWYDQVTPEELQRIITTSSESTGLEAEERELLSNVFEFGDVSAGEVMVPRTSIVAVPDEASFKALLEEVADSGHSRYPVIGESLDDIRGVIHFRELAAPMANETLSLEDPIQPWIRSARFVPEYMLLSDLLPLMQRSRQPMVVVVDEYGGTAGLVTIQDVIAQVFGDRVETAEDEEPNIKRLDDQTFLVQAQMNLEDVNKLLDLDLPLTDDYQTLGGFLIYQLQLIPQPGDQLEFDDCEFTVISADGPRLDQVRIFRRRPENFQLEDQDSVIPADTSSHPSSGQNPPPEAL